MLNAQMFLRPQRIRHREYRVNYKDKRRPQIINACNSVRKVLVIFTQFYVKREYVEDCSINITSSKFHQNPSGGKGCISCEWTDVTNVAVFFGNYFAQAPKKLRSSHGSGLEAQNLFVSFRIAVARSEAGAPLHSSRA